MHVLVYSLMFGNHDILDDDDDSDNDDNDDDTDNDDMLTILSLSIYYIDDRRGYISCVSLH